MFEENSKLAFSESYFIGILRVMLQYSLLCLNLTLNLSLTTDRKWSRDWLQPITGLG